MNMRWKLNDVTYKNNSSITYSMNNTIYKNNSDTIFKAALSKTLLWIDVTFIDCAISYLFSNLECVAIFINNLKTFCLSNN